MGFLGFSRKARLGLTLGGGGARGLAHIAFLKVLDELKIRPAVISGTSIGALIGALYAAGRSGEEIARIFRKLKNLDALFLVDFKWLRVNDGLIRGDRIVRTLYDLIGDLHFEDLRIPLRIVATDFRKHTEVVFASGPVVPAVRASISLPGVFEPIIRDGRVLIDGGMVNSLPYELIRSECDVLAAVNVLGERSPEGAAPVKPKILETILTAFHIMENAAIDLKMNRSQPDLYYKPELTHVDLLSFHQLDAALADAQAEAGRFAQDLRKNLGRFKK